MSVSMHERPVEETLHFNNQPFISTTISQAGETSLYYGFMPVQTPTLSPKDRQPAHTLSPVTISNMRNRPGSGPRKEYELGLRPEEKCAVIRMYHEEGMEELSQPVGLSYELPLAGDTRTRIREQQHGLDIIGTTRPIADATVIRTALAILHDEGYEDLYVSLNSLGDEDSRHRFQRDLAAYFRRHISSLSPKAQHLFKNNIYSLMHYDDEGVIGLKDGAPEPMEYLDEASRQHFMEVLEFLETLDIPYGIDGTLVADSYFTHTLFEIRRLPDSSEEKGELLARGGRYSSVAKKCGLKEDVPGVGISLCYKRSTRKRYRLTRVDTPQCYFVQLGQIAKLKSLQIIEDMRKHRIPLRHALSADKCTHQMSFARAHKTPLLILIGQQEALDDVAVVRDMATYAQEAVPIPELPQYIKKVMKSK